MNLNLSGKRVLVTGGSKGIGLGIAKAFPAEGAELILVSRDIDEAEASKKVGRPITAVNLDLSQRGAAEQLGGRFPNIDILVNNAGAVPGGSLFDVDDARWRAAWDLKVFGYINMCRTFYPLMAGRGGGTIVNIAGIGAIVKNPAAICIAAGNAVIIVISQTLGSASHRDNVRVVAVNPGPVATERLKAAASVQGNQKFNAAALLPWARPARVEEVGATVAFLASPLSSYTSGSVVTSTADCPRPPKAPNAFSLRSMLAVALVLYPDPATLSEGARRILAMTLQNIARMLAESGPLFEPLRGFATALFTAVDRAHRTW